MIPNLWHKQNIRQLQYMIQEFHEKSIAKNLTISLLEQLLLEAGLGKLNKTWNVDAVIKYCTLCWWLSLLKYAYDNDFLFNTDIQGPKPICRNNKLIMEHVITRQWKPSELKIINECQMILKATYLSGITTADGKAIME